MLDPRWREAMQREIGALELNNVEFGKFTTEQEISWLQVGVHD